ncbi:MAG TPA: hypothetical protein VHZ26_08800 [Caulobacteraceae bacterium]|jgi:hypothetical protein|nr:hypothetical protein [Caulobacteraceae bacterium]
MTLLRKMLPLAILAAGGWLQAGGARASGDFTCTTAWKLDQTTYADCNNLPFLSPGNDSRVNLQLLLIDAGKAVIGPPPTTDPPTPPIEASASPFTWEAFSDQIGPRTPGQPDSGDSVADPGSSDYASGEGSRCRTNADGAAAFAAALAASPGVPAAEKTALTAARQALSPNCDDSGPPAAYAPPAGVTSALGRSFSAYLVGTAGFYGGDFDGARKAFASLAASPQPWLKETARYMLGRVAVNQAQVGAFEDYGALSADKIDKAALTEARQAFDAYLKAYPKGLYAASARGLLRRVDWLGDQPQALAGDYAYAFAHPGPDQRNVPVGVLVTEADNKLLTKVKPADVGDPMLLATLDLMAMRTAGPNDDPPPSAIKFDELAAQKPKFAADPDLFAYLLAAHRLYLEADPAGALSYLGAPPPPGPMNDLGFSRLVLRGLALQAQKNWTGAQALWLRMAPTARPAFQRPMLDLALAWNEERNGGLTDVFAAGTPIRDPQVRLILLRNDAGPALLVQRVKATDAPALERRVARYVLLYKDVMRARYAAYAGDATLAAPKAPPPADPNNPNPDEPDQSLFDWPGASDGYVCEDLSKLVRALAADPRASHNLLCLGEFARQHSLDGYSLNSSAPADELGGAPTQFPGRTFARLDAYKQVLADPKAPAADRAYALYRAINCYAPSGNNGCDGQGVAKSVRAAWFHSLKTDYAGSDWARTLKYYW